MMAGSVKIHYLVERPDGKITTDDGHKLNSELAGMLGMPTIGKRGVWGPLCGEDFELFDHTKPVSDKNHPFVQGTNVASCANCPKCRALIDSVPKKAEGQPVEPDGCC